MRIKKNTNEKRTGLSIMAIVSFFISLAICSLLVTEIIISSRNIQILQIEQLVIEKTFRINNVISKLLYKANSLSAVIIRGDGTTNGFDRIAPIIMSDHSAILNVLLAPDGVVSDVYPLKDNEMIIGFDFFGSGFGNKEAVLARDSGRLVLGGPFRSIQGIEILTGRQPVFIDTPDEKNKFWGFVSVALKFPEILEDVELETLKHKGLSYELWRINPDTNEKQVMVANHGHPISRSRYIEKHISILGADWYLRVWPIRNWYSYPQNMMLVIAGLLISLLILFVVQNNYELRQIRTALEDMARSDPLTGIYNRHHFMEISQMYVERARRHRKDNCYIVIFDLDKFKNVNDSYGHIVGDKVLIETTSRIKAIIRPYDLFARYGGEEFIICASEIDRGGITEMVERLRLSICNEKFDYEDGVSVYASASFGVSHIDNYDVKKAISFADRALYMAKKNGRNNTVFWGEVNA